MTKDVFLALMTEEGSLRWEAEQMSAVTPPSEDPSVDLVRKFARETLPRFKRLRDLQRARGATHRPDL